MLKGIKIINDEGFIHCDLKPENILIEYSENEI
jgi:serine/threonine protein kinase